MTCSTFHALGLCFRASLQLKNKGMKDHIGTFMFVCNSRFSFVIFEARSRSSAMMFNQTPSVDTLCQFVKAKERDDDRLRVGDSALASRHAATCKGKGVVADNLKLLEFWLLFESHLRASMQKLSLPKMQVGNASILTPTSQNISFLKSPLAKLHSSKLQCWTKPVCRSWLQKLTSLK